MQIDLFLILFNSCGLFSFTGVFQRKLGIPQTAAQKSEYVSLSTNSPVLCWHWFHTQNF